MLGNSPVLVATMYLAHLWCRYFHMSYLLMFTVNLNGDHSHTHWLPRPWDSPGKNTGVGCHFLLQCMNVKSESECAQSSPTLSESLSHFKSPTLLLHCLILYNTHS